MKSKSWFVALVLGVLMFVLSACSMAGARAQFVQLPDTVQNDITALVVVVVSWLLARVIALIPALAFLDEFRLPFALALASQLIGYIQNAVPDAYGAVAILDVQLILAVVALFLAAEKLRAKGVKAFK